MKLSELTITALQNCAKFNQHIVIAPGKVIKTVNEKKTTLISCLVEDEFPVEVPLHDLSGFLKVLKLFTDPDFKFGEKSVVITDATGASQEYYYSDKEDLIYDERDVNFPEADIELSLPEEKLKAVISAATTLGVEDIAIVGEGGKVYLKALDKEKPKRVHSMLISEEDLGEFKVFLKHSKKGNKLDFLPLNYHVEINKKKIIQFTAKVEDVEFKYFMAMERDSEFA